MAADITDTPAPLQHVRVVNVGAAWAGRVTSMLLADQGADVVEVLRPGLEPHACDPLLGRGKRLIEVDLKSASGRARIETLAVGADIVIDNMRPGVSDRLGLGYTALQEHNPHVVYVALPGFAEGDPNRNMPAWEGVINAAALRPLTLQEVAKQLATIPGAGVGAVRTLAEVRAARTIERDSATTNGLNSGSFVLARGPHPCGFRTTLPLPTWFRPSQSVTRFLHPAPAPGADTVSVLKDAGWSDQELTQRLEGDVACTGWPILPHYLPQ